MPAPRAVPTDLHALLDDTLALYDGLFSRRADSSGVRRRSCRASGSTRADPRVVINLVDNAIEAMERQRADHASRRSTIAANNVVAAGASPTTGPAFRPAERDKLFMPYYSTKRRGSGLGLAIVRRIVAEHGGTIEVGDNEPRGRTFTIELPC